MIISHMEVARGVSWSEENRNRSISSFCIFSLHLLHLYHIHTSAADHMKILITKFCQQYHRCSPLTTLPMSLLASLRITTTTCSKCICVSNNTTSSPTVPPKRRKKLVGALIFTYLLLLFLIFLSPVLQIYCQKYECPPGYDESWQYRCHQ